MKKPVQVDHPVNPADDRLGRQDWARSFAEQVLSIDCSRGLVVCLNGLWGSGKSTLLDMVEAAEPDAITLRFNPWSYEPSEDLARVLLRELAIKIKPDGTGKKAIQAIGTILSYAGALEISPEPISQVTGKAAGKIGAWLGQSAEASKRNVSELMRSLEKPLLVLIDDIDRMSPNEQAELFRAIKSVADFPNVIYVLSMDRKRTADAIGAALTTDGEAYIEKIVQIQWEVPPPAPSALYQMFLDEINELLSPAGSLPQKQLELFQEIVGLHLKDFLQTPRDVRRLIGALTLLGPKLWEDLCIADAVAIQYLRLYHPGFYRELAKQAHDIAGTNRSGVVGGSTDPAVENKKLAESLLSESKEKVPQQLLEMLAKVFPRLGDAWGGMWAGGYGPTWLPEWQRTHRACHPSMTGMYFDYPIDHTVVSPAVERRLLASIGSPAEVDAVLDELLSSAGEQRKAFADNLLRYLRVNVDGATALFEAIDVTKFLVRNGDKLLQVMPQGDGLFDMVGSFAYNGALMDALALIDPGVRLETLQGAVGEDAPGIAIFRFGWRQVLDLGMYGMEDDARPTEALLTNEETQALLDLGIKKMQGHAYSELESHPDVRGAIRCWAEVDKDSCIDWLSKEFGDDPEKNAHFLLLMTTVTRMSGGSGYIRKEERLERRNFDWWKSEEDLRAILSKDPTGPSASRALELLDDMVATEKRQAERAAAKDTPDEEE